jgi:hypothetical protein
MDTRPIDLPLGALSLVAYLVLRLSGLALGRFAILGHIAVQAPQRAVATKAFEVDIRVGVGCPDIDGGVTQLMKCPAIGQESTSCPNHR